MKVFFFFFFSAKVSTLQIFDDPACRLDIRRSLAIGSSLRSSQKQRLVIEPTLTDNSRKFQYELALKYLYVNNNYNNKP